MGNKMIGLNVIWVFSPDCKKVLMCKRHKEPFKGLYNLVGGKIESGENNMDAAYRELAEETGFITGESITIDGGMSRLMVYHGDHGWELK